MAEVDIKNTRILLRSSHPDVFCKKGALKYLIFGQGYRKTSVQEPFLKKIF